MVGVTGIEPVTPSMSTKCSPAELYARHHRGIDRATLPRNRRRAILREIEHIKGFQNPFYSPIVVWMTKSVNHDHPTVKLAFPGRWTSSCIFSSPHSGSEYPEELVRRSHLNLNALRSSEDAFVDELFSAAPGCGAPLLSARLPRAWIDLNRSAREFDPALISGVNASPRSPRINAGLGVIPRVVSEGRAIMHGKITLAEAVRRIEAGYQPYHDILAAVINETRENFGHAILVDCHSMPHDALAGWPSVEGNRPEIVLGDRFGASCHRWIIDAATDIFRAEGFSVARNAPFAGGYITQHYGKPSRNVHALQIEIDRSLYMNEAKVTKLVGFTNAQRRISAVVRGLCEIGALSMDVAAE